ncbi:hypothetical protein [Candidatus Accumulibacter vicinus]|uniref:Helix-turn-helix domain-containing protein n=1 Tax=Candidatus Accumulibacter vicinus TaxID=2954382 RepID=A0A084Y2C9_9PROT|nr:hypothetical protein [Candidatus Accumulibacter vicinus]KFB68873.1 MAG: hypothetical protein CAPSK01_001728 [Candidatus Accumulibacter vicinus]
MSAKVLITTREAAALMGIQVKTLIVMRCIDKDGKYRGVLPIKRANGHLMWPKADLEKLKAAKTNH